MPGATVFRERTGEEDIIFAGTEEKNDAGRHIEDRANAIYGKGV